MRALRRRRHPDGVVHDTRAGGVLEPDPGVEHGAGGGDDVVADDAAGVPSLAEAEPDAAGAVDDRVSLDDGAPRAGPEVHGVLRQPIRAVDAGEAVAANLPRATRVHVDATRVAGQDGGDTRASGCREAEDRAFDSPAVDRPGAALTGIDLYELLRGVEERQPVKQQAGDRRPTFRRHGVDEVVAGALERQLGDDNVARLDGEEVADPVAAVEHNSAGLTRRRAERHAIGQDADRRRERIGAVGEEDRRAGRRARDEAGQPVGLRRRDVDHLPGRSGQREAAGYCCSRGCRGRDYCHGGGDGGRGGQSEQAPHVALIDSTCGLPEPRSVVCAHGKAWASLRSVELEALIRALAPSEVLGRRPAEIRSLAYDARQVEEGALFFCVPGSRADGHDFAAEAVSRGAAALVAQRAVEVAVPQLIVDDARTAMAVAADAFYGEPTTRLDVVGVTGTNGKTTTAFLLRSVLEASGRRTGLVGTVEWVVGGQRRPAPHTTPEAIDLQRLFAEMLERGDEAVALEASSHGSALHRLDRVRLAALVFTNLSQDHLDLHGTMEEYFQAKRRLFTGAQPPPAAVNVGDEHGRRLATELTGAHRAPLVTFGFADDADVRPDAIEVSARGSRLRAAGIDLETPLRGRFNVENVLGAVATGLLLDLDDDAIAAGVRDMTGVPGRFEAVDEGQPFAVVVDYAHTPDSLDTVLQAARDLADGRVIAVFGAGGDRDRGKRPLMGRIARERADLAIVTSDNPRSEDPLAIIEDVLQGAGLEVEIDPDRRSAIRRAVGLAAPGDVVVIAGKGHEQGQEVAGIVYPFDDRDVAREAIREVSAAP